MLCIPISSEVRIPSSSLRAKSPLVFFLIEEDKSRLCMNRVKPLKWPQPDFLDWSILFSLVNLVFFECKHLFTDKPMVITEPTIPSARGMGSKLYPGNMRACSTKMSFLSTQKLRKQKKGSAGRVHSFYQPLQIVTFGGALVLLRKVILQVILNTCLFCHSFAKGKASHRFSGNVPPKWGIILTMSLATFLLINQPF